MKKVILLNLLLVISCGDSGISVPICTTKCGLLYQGRVTSKDQDYSCEEIQHIEDRLVGELSPQYPAVCRALNNWSVWNHTETKWTDYWGRLVAGLTNCKNFQTEIGLAPIKETALAHEMVHMVQSCYTEPPLDPGMDDYHGDWKRKDLFSLIDRVNTP